MKKQTPILILLLLFLSIGLSQKEYNVNDLESKYGNPDLIKINTFSPKYNTLNLKIHGRYITGVIYSYVGEYPYKKVYLGNLRNGKKEGLWTSYHGKALRKYQGYYKNGKLIEIIGWSIKQQKKSSIIYKSGELISENFWNEDSSVSVSFGQNKVNIKNLVQHGEKWFRENDDRPFSGIVFDISKETGNKILECNYLKGLQNGSYVEWYNNGVKKTKGQYKNSLMTGKWIYYHKNGAMYGRGVFLNGDGLNKSELFPNIPKNGREGQWVFWYQNRLNKEESKYINGELSGSSILWYENGQKKEESIFKNDELNGYSKFWYDNGNIKQEVTYKDGKVVKLIGKWNKDGSLKE